MNSETVGVIIGRFQVPYLHIAHRKLIAEVLRRHTSVIFLIGERPTPVNYENPLPSTIIYKMLDEYIRSNRFDLGHDIQIKSIKDRRSDPIWSESVDSYIEELRYDEYTQSTPDFILYGGRDSFISRYSGKYKTVQLDFEEFISGTKLRQVASRLHICNDLSLHTEDFRNGQINAIMNLPPRLYSTVDVACIRPLDRAPHMNGKTVKDFKVLLGRKPDEDKFRFPGGHVDLEDTSLEAAAYRELYEETSICGVDFRYLCSQKIDDWRIRGVDKVGYMTNFFICNPYTGLAKANDDIAEIKWFNLAQNIPIMEEHQRLLDKLTEYINKGSL